MGRYAAGRQKEWDARRRLARRGYEVTRSAGSKGLADLIADNGKEVLRVQVKYTSDGRWEDANWRRLRDKVRAREYAPCVRVAAFIYTRGVREPRVIFVNRGLR